MKADVRPAYCEPMTQGLDGLVTIMGWLLDEGVGIGAGVIVRVGEDVGEREGVADGAPVCPPM
jgi:hypothetical protein